jgi:hypothetical protein
MILAITEARSDESYLLCLRFWESILHIFVKQPRVPRGVYEQVFPVLRRILIRKAEAPFDLVPVRSSAGQEWMKYVKRPIDPVLTLLHIYDPEDSVASFAERLQELGRTADAEQLSTFCWALRSVSGLHTRFVSEYLLLLLASRQDSLICAQHIAYLVSICPAAFRLDAELAQIVCAKLFLFLSHPQVQAVAIEGLRSLLDPPLVRLIIAQLDQVIANVPKHLLCDFYDILANQVPDPQLARLPYSSLSELLLRIHQGMAQFDDEWLLIIRLATATVSCHPNIFEIGNQLIDLFLFSSEHTKTANSAVSHFLFLVRKAIIKFLVALVTRRSLDESLPLIRSRASEIAADYAATIDQRVPHVLQLFQVLVEKAPGEIPPDVLFAQLFVPSTPAPDMELLKFMRGLITHSEHLPYTLPDEQFDDFMSVLVDSCDRARGAESAFSWETLGLFYERLSTSFGADIQKRPYDRRLIGDILFAFQDAVDPSDTEGLIAFARPCESFCALIQPRSCRHSWRSCCRRFSRWRVI